MTTRPALPCSLEVAELTRAAPLRGSLFAASAARRGLFGSTACADAAAAEQWAIDVVINLDMVAFQTPHGPTWCVEYDQGNHHPGNDPAAKAFGLLMAQAAADYTNLAIEHTDIWNSDYMPFEAKGYACIGVYEGGENPHYHKTTDTAATVNPSHLAEVSKMVLATAFDYAIRPGRRWYRSEEVRRLTHPPPQSAASAPPRRSYHNGQTGRRIASPGLASHQP